MVDEDWRRACRRRLEACSTLIAMNRRVEQALSLCFKRQLCRRADALICRRCLREGLNKPTNGLSSELRNGGISRLKTFESRRSGGCRGEFGAFWAHVSASITPTAKTAQIGRNHGGTGMVRSSICCAMLPGRPSPSAGVRRVSLGEALYRRAVGGLAAAAEALQAGDLQLALRGAVLGRDLSELLRP